MRQLLIVCTVIIRYNSRGCQHIYPLSIHCQKKRSWGLDNDIMWGNNLLYHPSFRFVLFELLFWLFLWFLSFMLWYVGMLYAFIFLAFVRREVWIHQTSLTPVIIWVAGFTPGIRLDPCCSSFKFSVFLIAPPLFSNVYLQSTKARTCRGSLKHEQACYVTLSF